MPKILVGSTNYSVYCREGLALLESAGYTVEENTHGRPLTPEELAAAAADAVGVIAGVEQWDEAAFAAAPELKVIVRFGTGYDTVDLEAAKRHGVQVANTPGLNADSVAEHVAAFILCMLRELIPLNASTRAGGWDRVVYRELSTCTVGMIGFGAIGRRLAHKLSGFSPRLIAYDIFPNEEAGKQLGVEFVSFEELLAQSDFITIHLPLTKDNFHMMDAAAFAKMKKGACLINAARGPLVDEKAAAEALANGTLGAFAADVHETEPMAKDDPLVRFPNYIATPHLAGESETSYRNTGIATATGVLNVLQGRPLDHRLV